jgi:hypothetical protein
VHPIKVRRAIDRDRLGIRSAWIPNLLPSSSLWMENNQFVLVSEAGKPGSR